MRALLLPFLLDCLTLHRCFALPLDSTSHDALLSVLAVSRGSSALDWTMRQSSSPSSVTLSAGKHSKTFIAGRCAGAICTTLFDAVQFHSTPGQFGPA